LNFFLKKAIERIIKHQRLFFSTDTKVFFFLGLFKAILE